MDHVEHGDIGPADGAQLVLGPDEIVNYPLRKATRGYRTDEVDDLLDQLAVQTQDLLAELQRLEEERDRLGRQLAEASETESMLKKTLVTAQRAAEASVAEAREEADELRRRARERAEQLLADAAEQAHELREAALRRARADEADIRRYRRDVEEHVESLRTFAADHRARLAHHLELQQERLAEMDLPEAPPEPERAEDEILDSDLERVDVRGMVDDLTADEQAAEDLPADEPAADEPSGGVPPTEEDADGDELADREASDEADEQQSVDDVDTAERLFGS